MLRPYKEATCRSLCRSGESERGRALGGDGEGALESDADAPEGAFLEETPDQGDAVGHAARGRELWKGIFRIGSPVRAGLGDLDEASSKRERRMAGIIADGEHFVAQRGNEQQIHLRKEAGHFFGDFAAEAVGLDKINGGEETRLTEKIGPGVGGLHFELVDAVAEGEFLESGGAFGEENQVERVVRPIGKRSFDRNEAELWKNGQRGAVYFGGRSLTHPRGEIADAKALDAGGRIKIETAGDTGKIAGIGSGDGLQDEQCVFDGARHGAEFVERPAEGHGTGARHATVSGAQPGDAATHAGADDAAAGFAANRKAHQTGSGSGAWAGAGTGSAFLKEPGVHGLSAEPNVVERERAEAELRQEHGASGL